jgi:hypothetical protein
LYLAAANALNSMKVNSGLALKNRKNGKFLHLLVPIISRNHQKRCNLAIEAGSLPVAMPSLAGAVKIASGKAAEDLKHDSQ